MSQQSLPEKTKVQTAADEDEGEDGRNILEREGRGLVQVTEKKLDFFSGVVMVMDELVHTGFSATLDRSQWSCPQSPAHLQPHSPCLSILPKAVLPSSLIRDWDETEFPEHMELYLISRVSVGSQGVGLELHLPLGFYPGIAAFSRTSKST